MRIFATIFAIAALATAPCAWDSDPREPSLLAALVSGSASATGAEQGAGLPQQAPHEELADPFFN
ncbi:hypothetical protein JVX98_01170 (plasmid) [Ensifer sp. PDNC004]|uniref:hypothetical protein n=1 Tax=Ensifer sp. PDNC004 TaxID=2811423 RepID=UPI00196289A9|nr:hypothetical protein [Ensifer sp. PDNC004]QRY65739.1 hypothetical protein JVX98_01170 [Ensifer sp. PDNC004]